MRVGYRPSMEMRHLFAFVAVAEELNFTHAAARLRVAQPALSIQIKDLDLEEQFKREVIGRGGSAPCVWLDNLVLWYFPECKIAVISTSYADMSVSQNVEKSVTQCARPLRFPWTSPM